MRKDNEHKLKLKKDNDCQLEKEKRAKKEGQRRIQEALVWLCTKFPECFNFKQPIPLKREIEKDIFPYLSKNSSITKATIKAAIIYYTRNIRYQKAVSTFKHRFDLKGNPVSDVKKSEKEYAQKRIAWVEDKLRKASASR